MEAVQTVFWQKLMDSAYAKWQEDWSSEQFYSSLSDLEKKACALGNFNYQVENGGFLQWIDNRYAKLNGKDAHFYLTQINTESSQIAVKLVNTALALQDDVLDWSAEDEESQSWNDLLNDLHDLDKQYYAINSQLMADIENWLHGEVVKLQAIIDHLSK